jgi:hypothetical protein
LDQARCLAEPSDTGDEQGAEVLTRGPVHEAFAGVVTFNPEPGVVVPKAPPEAIEEVPPDVKPEGDNVTWIPGYWAWDDERGDFLWVSGVWRALPPGRQWVPGYWAKSGEGYQWTSGYWADAAATETAYLPPPPPTIEAGPNIAAPSPDYYWAPGCWVWYDARYAWRPGYWVLGRPDWDWCPAYYTYTPRGYVFVDGYWDYSVGLRGVLFAPVYFGYGVYSRPHYYYSPRIVIDLAVFPEHLFLCPRYHHCYFGDYYAVNYYRAGFYASFSFQSRHHGYDPIFCQRRWEHRNDRGWDRQVATTYQYRRDHVEARPPRTWAAQASITTGGRSKDRSLAVATSFDQLSKRKDSPMRFQPVAKEEKQQFVQRAQEVRKVRDERQTLESSAGGAFNAKPGKKFPPSTAKLPRSPIVSQSSDRLGRDQPPPSPRQVGRPATNVGPKRETSKPDSNVNKNNRQSEQPKGEYREKPVPSQREAKPETERPVKREAKPDVERPAKREAPPEVQKPVRREALPEAQRPVRHEAPPEAQQPSKHEAKPVPTQPAKEQPRESDKGETRNEHKGEQNKDEEQQAPPGK